MQNKLIEAEIWRTSPYEGYSVSTLGNVRNDRTGCLTYAGVHMQTIYGQHTA